MKKTILGILAVFLMFTSQAQLIWVTNSTDQEISWGFDPLQAAAGPTMTLPVGSSGSLSWSPSDVYVYWNYDSGDNWLPVPSDVGDYSLNIQSTGVPQFVPIPEPSIGAFFLGFFTMLGFWGFGATRRMAMRAAGGNSQDF